MSGNACRQYADARSGGCLQEATAVGAVRHVGFHRVYLELRSCWQVSAVAADRFHGDLLNPFGPIVTIGDAEPLAVPVFVVKVITKHDINLSLLQLDFDPETGATIRHLCPLPAYPRISA